MPIKELLVLYIGTLKKITVSCQYLLLQISGKSALLGIPFKAWLIKLADDTFLTFQCSHSQSADHTHSFIIQKMIQY